MAYRQCMMCKDFVTSDQELMKRHVAIVHGKSTFSTLQCAICDGTFYDSDHFQDHIREKPSCASDCYMITPVPMEETLEKAFLSLVDQMMKPVHFPSTPALSVSSATAELAIGEMASPIKTSILLPMQSNSQHLSSKSACNNGDYLVTPKRFSVTSPSNQRILDDFLPAAVDSVGQIDMQQKDDQDGLEVFLDREARRSVETRAKNIEGAINQSSTIVGNGLGGGMRETRSILPPHIRAQQRTCFDKVKRYIRDGKLACMFCRHWITISNNIHGNIRRAYNHAMTHVRDVHLFECTTCHFRASNPNSMNNHIWRIHNPGQRKFIDHRAKYYLKISETFLACYTDESYATSRNGKVGGQHKILARKPTGKRSIVPPHILHARRVSWEKVEKFVNDGKLKCRLCSQSIQVSKTKLESAIAHATRHVGCRIFECSICHVTSASKSSMYTHTKKCQNGSPAKIIIRFNQYYREIFNQFLDCFELESSGERWNVETMSIDTEQGTQVARGHYGKIGSNFSSLKPMKSTHRQDQDNGVYQMWLHHCLPNAIPHASGGRAWRKDN